MSEALKLDDDAVDLIGDALGHLWMTAPARRDEIAELCKRTGLAVVVDA